MRGIRGRRTGMVLAIGLALTLAGCATQVPLGSGAEAVQVVSSADALGGCTLVQTITVEANLTGDVDKQWDTRARNAAFEVGATHVLRTDTPTGMQLIGRREYKLYRCP